MSMERDFAVFIESVGGEDLLRWLMRDEGMVNWDVAPLYPIVAYEPKYLTKPIVIGVATKTFDRWDIMAQEWDFEHLHDFQKYVDYLMEMGGYESPLEALLDHNRAIILNEIDLLDAKERGLIILMTEVVNGVRIDEFQNQNESLNFEVEGLEMFITIISNLLDDHNTPKIELEDDSFNHVWQKNWA